MYKHDLALNNQQGLICHKTHSTKPNQTKPILIHRLVSYPRTHLLFFWGVGYPSTEDTVDLF